MKILTSKQLKEADAYTINSQNITSWQLMERAAETLFLWVKKHLCKNQLITVLAGVGNNGGDGLALARMLHQDGWKVTVYELLFSENFSADYLQNKNLLTQIKLPITSITPENTSDILWGDVVIDAIFGIGLSRPAPQWLQSLFALLNNSNSYILSVDMPSGLPIERVPLPEEQWVHPNIVLTFQTPKRPFFLPATGQYIPAFEVLNIGLDTTFLNNLSPDYYLLEPDICKLQKNRAKFSHKGTYGHALLIGGSYGKMGAVVLSGTAVLRTGAGLLTVAIPSCGYTILQTALPEAMAITSQTDQYYSTTPIPFTPSSIGVGIGCGTHPNTATALFDLFEQYPNTPFVIDADALNILAQNPEKQVLLPKKAILTPHPKELERLIGQWTDDLDKLTKTKAFARKHEVIILIKGAYSIITDGIKCWINSTGNPGMATAGSGDVLTGILTGLLAQGYTPLEATCLGVYTHGQKGDTVAERIGQEALIARDLIAVEK